MRISLRMNISPRSRDLRRKLLYGHIDGGDQMTGASRLDLWIPGRIQNVLGPKIEIESMFNKEIGVVRDLIHSWRSRDIVRFLPGICERHARNMVASNLLCDILQVAHRRHDTQRQRSCMKR